jgi:6-phosphogluconolactonase
VDTSARFVVRPDAGSLAEAVAELVARQALVATGARGRFVLALSGGATPLALFRALVRAPWRSQVPWEATEVLWVDERCVPPDDPRSNYGAAERELLGLVAVDAARVHRVRGEAAPELAAAAYAAEVANVLGGEGQLDLVLLGIGSDGHTASLFPGAASLDAVGACVATPGPEPGPWRVTLCLPVISAARLVVFIATGRDKAPAVARALGGPDRRTPASLVRPAEGDLVWALDDGAAEGLWMPER